MSEPELITLPDFARKHSVSTSSIYRWIASGRLKIEIFKRGNRNLFKAAEADVAYRAMLTATGGDRVTDS